MEKFRDKFKSIPVSVWILLGIVIIGAFLRTYRLHDWLDFGSDQVNDAMRVSSVVEGKATWPLLGPDMSDSGVQAGRESRFRLGSMYYYFEIISAKIFGNYPDKMAYPDTLFGILSIPLLFFFLKKYFRENSALVLTGLYAISFYSLSFSHSAWNPNSIPFFALLFLLAWLEFMSAKKKTGWVWVFLLGISIGVGIQLHAILLVLFPVTSLFLGIYLLRKDSGLWKKFAAILLCVIILNGGQIISEQKTDFANSKVFFGSIFNSEDGGGDKLSGNLAEDIDCHMEANVYILSSIGGKNCQFSFIKAWDRKDGYDFLESLRLFVIFIFSASGYVLLGYFSIKEKNETKKYFLSLVVLYSILSFFTLLPVIDAPLRYFVHVIFIPFIFLGFLIDFLIRKYPKGYLWIVIIIISFLVITNFISIKSVTDELFVGERNSTEVLVLGEIEKIDEYMISQSGSQKEIYLCVSGKYTNFFKSLEYVAEKKKMDIIRSKDCEDVPLGKNIFFLWQSSQNDPGNFVRGNNIESYKNFGQVGIYKLQN